ncbi:phosphatase PAP2 family protein [Chitinophaga filiformis]|uniref:phosphatase PAP2 family protein n=1 Tax=Chitinophaga filiformis TaxID=104663 RepID=UPI001F36F5E3|nr:phosphatase PAP2 family protein [Chitinophaga filiformis]MCF6402833.1 phosphatase PAP2 family protein [Chitinophaga filiformis]MCF6403249.1 phosphatase PAP2 family protein [Chitinophaga filiformis]
MCKKFLCLCLLIAGLLPHVSSAQQQDSIINTAAPKFQPDSFYQHRPENIKRRYKGLLLVPATFIVYGAASLSVNSLKGVNNHFKEEIYLEGNRRVYDFDNYLQYAPAFLVYGLNAAGIKGKNNFLDRTAIYAMANIIMGSTVMATKHLTHEKRPDGSNYLSFPSGHTATAFAAAEFMMREYKDVSIWYGVAGYAMAAATGYLRMSNNRHWLGDIVAGAGVGILSTELAYYLYPSVKRIFRNKKTDIANVILPTYQQGTFGLSVVHTFN